MTLWQDPPQTRRQARENERSAQQKAAGQASRRAGTAEPTPGGEIPIVTTPYSFSAGKVVENGDAEKPSIPATAFEEPGVNPPSRPNLPEYGSSFDALLAPSGDARDGDGDEEVRDPDAGAASLFRGAPNPDEVEPVTKPVTVLTPPPTPSPVSSPQASATAPVVPAPAVPSVNGQSERILTRREMRAMLQAQEANQQAGHVEAALPVSFTPPTDASAAGAAAASQTPPSQAPTPVPATPASPVAEVTSSNAGGWPFAPLVPSTGQSDVPTAGSSESPAEAAVAQSDDSADDKQSYQPPVGHWSQAAELDDKNQPFDQIISRSVGASGAATTTNALILPVLPSVDATGPLTSTGEILVTGSIDLPRGLGSTGAHPDRVDSSDLDRLLDGEENEFNTSEVAPIRASRAVSTHTSTRGVITPPKKRGGKLPIILMITAGVLAVGVIGLLVAAYVLNVF